MRLGWGVRRESWGLKTDIRHTVFNKGFCLFFCFVIVNNVGMTYSDNFAYFLEIPDAEQVRFAFLM